MFSGESYKTLFNMSHIALVIVMTIKLVLTTLTVFILLLLFSVVAGAFFVQAADPAWDSKAPMQEARSGLGLPLSTEKSTLSAESEKKVSALPTKNMIPKPTLGL